MMKKLEPIDELTAEINEMRTERIRESSTPCLGADTYLLQARKESKSFSGCQRFLCRVIMPKHMKIWWQTQVCGSWNGTITSIGSSRPDHAPFYFMAHLAAGKQS